MSDLEKVLNGIEEVEKCGLVCDVDGKACLHFPQPLIDDIKQLLKRQQPTPPIVTENAYGWKFYHCPSCGREFYGNRMHGAFDLQKFCNCCGQAVKWDD